MRKRRVISKTRGLTPQQIRKLKGAGLFDFVKKAFSVVNDIGKPFRGVAAQVFNQLPIVKQTGIDVTPFMGAANDAILGANGIRKIKGSGLPRYQAINRSGGSIMFSRW